MLKENQWWWAFTFKNLLFDLFHWYDKNCTKYYFFASTSGTAIPYVTYSYIILHRYWYWIWASFKFDIQKNLIFFFEFHTVLQIDFYFSIEFYLGSLNISAWSVPEFFGSGSEFEYRFGSGFNRFYHMCHFWFRFWRIRFYGSNGSTFFPKITLFFTIFKVQFTTILRLS